MGCRVREGEKEWAAGLGKGRKNGLQREERVGGRNGMERYWGRRKGETRKRLKKNGRLMKCIEKRTGARKARNVIKTLVLINNRKVNGNLCRARRKGETRKKGAKKIGG